MFPIAQFREIGGHKRLEGEARDPRSPFAYWVVLEGSMPATSLRRRRSNRRRRTFLRRLATGLATVSNRSHSTGAPSNS